MPPGADGQWPTVLITPRTRMRPHRVDDFENSAALWADENVVRRITGKASTRSESWSRLLRYMGHWQALNFGYWVVEDRVTGAFLGEVGFANYKRDISPSIDRWPEIGWVLASHAHGRGLASETVAAALTWGDRNLAADRTVCIFDPEHRASIRVAEKNGYAEKCHASFAGSPTLIMERMKPEI